MKKLALALVVICALCLITKAYALGDSENTNTNTATSASSATTGASTSSIKDSGNASVGNGINNLSPSADASATIAKGAVNNEISNRNSNDISNRNSNSNRQGQLQGQLQGQIANGKVETDVKVQGDTNKVYANSWPAVGVAEGVSSGTASSIFGSLGLSSTEKYKKYMPQIQTVAALVKDGLLTQEEGRAIIKPMVDKLVRTNKTQRVCGILWETDGKNLSNLFGIMSWDSFWKDGEPQGAVVVAPAAPKTTVDKGVTGNGGNVNTK